MSPTIRIDPLEKCTGDLAMPDNVKTYPKTPTDVKTTPMAALWPKEWRSASFEPLSAMNRRAFECWARSMSRLSHEMAQFMQQRLIKDSAMWEKLATCRDPADALKCQSLFASESSADLADAVQKFSRLMTDIASSYGRVLQQPQPETD
jgi:Phasin protein